LGGHESGQCAYGEKPAYEISLPYKKEKGYVEGVNAKSLLIRGVV